MVLPSCSQNSGCYLKARVAGLVVRMELAFEGMLSKGQYQEQELKEPCLQNSKPDAFVQFAAGPDCAREFLLQPHCASSAVTRAQVLAVPRITQSTSARLHSVSLLSCGDLIGH